MIAPQGIAVHLASLSSHLYLRVTDPVNGRGSIGVISTLSDFPSTFTVRVFPDRLTLTEDTLLEGRFTEGTEILPVLHGFVNPNPSFCHLFVKLRLL